MPLFCSGVIDVVGGKAEEVLSSASVAVFRLRHCSSVAPSLSLSGFEPDSRKAHSCQSLTINIQLSLLAFRE